MLLSIFPDLFLFYLVCGYLNLEISLAYSFLFIVWNFVMLALRSKIGNPKTLFIWNYLCNMGIICFLNIWQNFFIKPETLWLPMEQ